LAKNKHLILDVSVIIDLWLGSGSAEATEALMDLAIENKARLWIAASSIPILDYVMRRALKRKGASPEEAGEIVPALMRDLMSVAGVLTNFGFDQQAIYQAARDAEDAQIAAAGRNFNGVPVCVVSEDACFDTLDEIPVKTPAEALTWLYRETADNPAPMSFIDLATQQAELRSGIEQGIARVLHHGRYIMGPEVKQLEEKLAAYTEVPHCITCASGTDALLMALMALDIGPCDEVITVPYTWISTAEVISLLRARPVFVDVRPDTFNLDPEKLEAAITPNTKAIMPVGLYGQCADMTGINAIAERHGIPVIEDAAQCFGATHHGQKACNLSGIGCTSFFPSKPLGGYGDGGAVFTPDPELAERLRQIRIHGQKVKHQHPLVGINGRLDTLQAAILLEKFTLFEEECALRAEVGRRYDALLATVPGIRPPVIAAGNTSVYAQYTILSADRDGLSQKLKAAGIPSVAYYTAPLHLQGAFADLGHKPGDFPVSEQIAAECLSLPMSPYLTEEEQQSVAKAMK
jgi:UDP-2-acetamido-2-deoxy-ribo-hexuluronate aminotransferase